MKTEDPKIVTERVKSIQYLFMIYVITLNFYEKLDGFKKFFVRTFVSSVNKILNTLRIIYH